MVWWQWSPGLDGIARAGLDPSSARAFHQPLIDAVHSTGEPIGRIEVVPTQRHWEMVYVATELALARGWERQLDIGRNALFYGTELGADAYHRWLRDHAVRYVALADVPVDPPAVEEARLVAGGLPFLEPVWRDEHWQLWQVVDAAPMVDGPARLVHMARRPWCCTSRQRNRRSCACGTRVTGHSRRRAVSSRARTAGPSCTPTQIVP